MRNEGRGLLPPQAVPLPPGGRLWRVVEGADPYRGLGRIAVSSVGAFIERPRATNGRPYRGLYETIPHTSVGEGLAPPARS